MQRHLDVQLVVEARRERLEVAPGDRVRHPLPGRRHAHGVHRLHPGARGGKEARRVPGVERPVPAVEDDVQRPGLDAVELVLAP